MQLCLLLSGNACHAPRTQLTVAACVSCRLAATRFMVLEDGGTLPPPPNLSQLVDRVGAALRGCLCGCMLRLSAYM